MIKTLKKLHWTIYVLITCSGVLSSGFMMLVPILPAYANDLNFNEYEIGLLVGGYMLGSVALKFPIGVISDHVGRNVIMAASILLFAVSTLGYALTTDATAMIALRMLQGVAAGGFFISYETYINDRTPRELRGLANGLNSGAVNAGIITGTLLGGFLSQAFEITTPFFVISAMGFICFFVVLRVPRMQAHGQVRQWHALLPTFSRLKKTITPIFSVHVMSLSMIHFIQLMSGTMIMIVAPIIMSDYFSWSSAEISLAMSVPGGAAVLSSVFIGRLSDVAGQRIRVLVLGMIAMIVAAVAVYLHVGTTSSMTLTTYGLVIMIAALFISGLGTPAYYSSFCSLIGDVTSISERGAVGGFINSFGEWGSVIAASFVAPYIWETYNVEAPAAVGAVVLIAGCILALSTSPFMNRQIMKIEAKGAA